MSAYMILVLLVLPAPPGYLSPALELDRAYITASSPAACKAHADKMADEQRRRHEDAVKRMQAQVVGTCEPMKSTT